VFPGDIAYNSMRMWQGVSGRSEYFGIVSPAYTVCVPAASCDSSFLAHLLKHPRSISSFRNRSQGLVSDTWNLKYRLFSEIRTRIPSSRAEQQRIAKILDTVDEAIRSTEHLVAKLRLMKQGLLHDLLTKGIDASGKLRDPLSDPDDFRESAIGLIPREWEVTTLADVGTWMSGATPSKAVSAFWNGSTPWVSPKDMKTLWLDRTIDSVSRIAVASGARVAPAGAVMIVVRGMILANSFPVSVISRPMAFNQDVKAIVATGVDSRFLAFWLVASAGLLLGLVTEATHGTKRIELGDLHRQPVPRPPTDEQARILSVLLDQESRIERESATLAKLQLVKKGVMDDLLTGRVRVIPLLEGDAA
jgi:type I restriction enzyme, S subunit